MPPSSVIWMDSWILSWIVSVVLMLGVHALLLLIPLPAGAQCQPNARPVNALMNAFRRLQRSDSCRSIGGGSTSLSFSSSRCYSALRGRRQEHSVTRAPICVRVSTRCAKPRYGGTPRSRVSESARHAGRWCRVHVALATVFLDWQRVADALHELDAASRDDNRRLDVHTLRALAYTLSDRPADAARALRTAATIDADNPTVFYALVQYAARANRQEEAQEALRGFLCALRVRGATGARVADVTPFERVDLLRQVAGVAPVFPQARYGDGFQDSRKATIFPRSRGSLTPSLSTRLSAAIRLHAIAACRRHRCCARASCCRLFNCWSRRWPMRRTTRRRPAARPGVLDG